MATTTKKRSNLVGSPEQDAIWEALCDTKKHLIVNALAGTGKTTTGIEGLILMGPKPKWLGRLANVAFVSFSNVIVDELKERVPQWANALTTHSLGRRMVMDSLGFHQLDRDKSFNHMLDVGNARGWRSSRQWPKGALSAILRLSSFCKNEGIQIPEDPEVVSDLTFQFFQCMVDQYGIVIPDNNLELIFSMTNELLSWSASDATKTIDFDDMLWLPFVYNLDGTKYDLLLVDESQDLNRVQQHILRRSSDRMVVIGDTYQSIYGFRGADARSMQRMQELLEQDKRGVEVLDLTVCRRCCKSVIELAQQIVPQIQHMPDAPEGLAEVVEYEELVYESNPGDLALCRTNAPLVRYFYDLIGRGKSAYIRGRKIGEKLVELLDNLTEYPRASNDILVVTDRLHEYQNAQLRRLQDHESSATQIANLQDSVQCLEVMLDQVSTVDDAKRKLANLFRDKGDRDMICLSSVHRAKGLESPNVFILCPELMPHPLAKQEWERQQESNIAYVGITRAKSHLRMAGCYPPATGM